MSEEEEVDDHMTVSKTKKRHGKKKGTATLEMDEHSLGYVLKGLNARIDIYEKMSLQPGGLADDDQKAFNFTKKLRDKIESARNETLPE